MQTTINNIMATIIAATAAAAIATANSYRLYSSSYRVSNKQWS